MRTVCFCNSNIPWGGGEKWHLEAALALARRGWRVLFLCRHNGELHRRLQDAAGVRILPLALGRYSFLNPLKRARLTRLFKREGVDAVIMNLPADLKAVAPAARAAGVEHIVYRRGSALPVRDSLLNRRLYGKVITRLIVNSEATRRQVLINNPALIAPERITMLPNSLDTAAFDEALQAAKRSAILSLLPAPLSSPPTFLIGNAGRLTRQKGQHLLLHLCRRLLDAGLDCAVIIAGTGEREAELQGLAKRLGLGDRAVFTGFMADLAPFWRSIDLFVLSSLWEGFGSVLLEAMLARRPVFAFAVSNIPELIFEGGPDGIGNGRLFPLPAEEIPYCPDISDRGGLSAPATGRGQASSPPSPEKRGAWRVPGGSERAYSSLDAMVRATLELAAHPESGKSMGEAGRRFALRFSQETCMSRLEELLA
ncbi:MAG: glycosyltransferase [Desulfovibrio sp.]|nr:glycosyltransferase [Desulfovibrio sp.]